MDVHRIESEITSSVEFEQPDFAEAQKRIRRAETEQSHKLDLSRLKLLEVPLEIYDLSRLRRLHLCRNQLIEIPDELCTRMCRLHWLDLRNNLLTRLPSSIRYMRSLQILLLDDNRIKTLPFELGLLRRLKGIFVRNNPLEFPSKRIMEKGPKEILKYLNECYISREESETPRGSKLYKRIMAEQNSQHPGKNNSAETSTLISECADKWFTAEQLAEFANIDMICKQMQQDLSISKENEITPSDLGKDLQSGKDNSTKSNSQTSGQPLESTISKNSVKAIENSSSNSSETDSEMENILKSSQLVEGVPSYESENCTQEGKAPSSTNDAILPWVASTSQMYKKIKRQYLDGKRNPRKPYSATAFGIFPSQSARHKALLPENPPQPTVERIRAQHSKEKQKKARQQAMIKQQAILQKLKDSERVRGWRQAYSNQQKAKLLEYLSKTQRDIREEADQRIVAAPFDVEHDSLRMLGTEELHSLRNRSIRSATPPPNLSADIVLQLELESLERDRRLTQQAQRHLSEVGDRFQHPLPYSREALQTEMLTAKRDLDLALRLHYRIKQRMETLNHFHGSNRRDLW